MRFRRVIFRSLAPLLGLSALMSAMAFEHPESAPPEARALARLLRSVVSFVTPAVEHASVKTSSSRPSPQSLLALSALAETPFSHSLWMVAQTVPVPRLARRPLRLSLRC